MSETRPGIFGIWGNDGAVSHEDSKRCIELLGNEVLPAVREIADDLGLTGPFEANAPVSLEHGESAVPATAAAGG
jgi:hypothetical protein